MWEQRYLGAEGGREKRRVVEGEVKGSDSTMYTKNTGFTGITDTRLLDTRMARVEALTAGTARSTFWQQRGTTINLKIPTEYSHFSRASSLLHNFLRETPVNSMSILAPSQALPASLVHRPTLRRQKTPQVLLSIHQPRVSVPWTWSSSQGVSPRPSLLLDGRQQGTESTI